MISLTPEALEAMISNAYARGLADAQSRLAKPKTASERAREYRERKRRSILETSEGKASQNVTENHENVTNRHENVTNITENVTECDGPEILPAPSLPSPTPPSLSPPPDTRTREGASIEVEKSNTEPSKPQKRQASAKALAELEADQANKVELPTTIRDHPELFQAWQSWCKWRTRLATTGRVGSKRHPWTTGAAQRAIKQILTIPPTQAVQEIYRALDHGWTGLHFENHETQGNHQFTRRPSQTSPRRTDTLNAPGRYSTPAQGSSTANPRANQISNEDLDFEL